MEVRWHDLWRIRHDATWLLYALGIDGMSDASLHRLIIYGLTGGYSGPPLLTLMLITEEATFSNQ